MWRGTPTLGPIPRCNSLLGVEDSIRRGCFPLKHGILHSGAGVRCDLLQNLQAPFWKGGSGRCKGTKTWKEMAQCLLPSQGLCPGPSFWMSELLVAS